MAIQRLPRSLKGILTKETALFCIGATIVLSSTEL